MLNKIPLKFRSRVVRDLLSRWPEHVDKCNIFRPEDVTLEITDGFLNFINTHTENVPIDEIIKIIERDSFTSAIEHIVERLDEKNLYFSNAELYDVLAHLYSNHLKEKLSSD